MRIVKEESSKRGIHELSIFSTSEQQLLTVVELINAEPLWFAHWQTDHEYTGKEFTTTYVLPVHLVADFTADYKRAKQA